MWPNPQETADFVTFTEKILNGKLHFLWSETCQHLTIDLFETFMDIIACISLHVIAGEQFWVLEVARFHEIAFPGCQWWIDSIYFNP